MQQREILIVGLLVVLVVSLTNGSGTDKRPRSDRALKKDFKLLEVYLSHRQVDWQDYGRVLRTLARLQSVLSFQWPRLRHTAKRLVYLNRVDICNRRALRYMNYIIRGRPTASWGLVGAKSALDTFLESTLIRAGAKCSSFFERWFEQSEQTLEPEIKRKLYEFLPAESIRHINGQTVGRLGEALANSTLRQESTGGQLLVQMHAQELFDFYSNYIGQLVEPCKSYMRSKMADLVETAARFELNSKINVHIITGHLFAAPSEAFSQALYRFYICKLLTTAPATFVKTYARKASTKLLENKNSNLGHNHSQQ